MENIQAVEFQNETTQIFEDINNSLDAIEKNPDNQELFYKHYLYWHEIKSLSTLFNLDDIAKLSHSIENLFDEVTKSRKTITKDDIIWLRGSLEYIRDSLREQIYDKPSEHDYNKLLRHHPAEVGSFGTHKEGTKAPPSRLHSPKAMGKGKVLVVEDEPINMALLEANIKNINSDLEIVSVNSAEEGLFLFFTQRFSLVFLDIMMPVIDGNDFIAIVEKNLLKKNITPPCNIVVQTAIQSISQLTSLAKRECVQEIIRKPISPGRIKECIERYC